MGFAAEEHTSLERTLRGHTVRETLIGKEGARKATVHHR